MKNIHCLYEVCAVLSQYPNTYEIHIWRTMYENIWSSYVADVPFRFTLSIYWRVNLTFIYKECCLTDQNQKMIWIGKFIICCMWYRNTAERVAVSQCQRLQGPGRGQPLRVASVQYGVHNSDPANTGQREDDYVRVQTEWELRGTDQASESGWAIDRTNITLSVTE